jgi:hypothetical protein
MALDSGLVTDNTASYSRCNGEMMAWLCDNPDQSVSIARQTRNVSTATLVENNYVISAWPMVIDHKMVRMFENFVTQLPIVFKAALRVYFERDAQSFATYFGEPARLYELFCQVEMDRNEMIARHDVLFCDRKLKILEVNAGCNLGGWEMDLLSLKVMNAVKAVPVLKGKQIEHRPVIKSLFSAISELAGALKKSHKTGNVLVHVAALPPQELIQFTHYIQSQYQAAPSYQGGEVLLCPNVHKVVFDDNHALSYQGKDIDAVVMLEVGIPDDVMDKFIDGYVAKQFVCVDTPMHVFFGHKSLLALMHEEKVKAGLPPQQTQWIDEHIPWSVRFDKQSVVWQGETVSLRDLITDNKDLFVLKKAVSMQGKDVVLGNNITQAQWLQSIQKVSDSGEASLWIVQQFYQPDSVWAADIDGNPGQFTPIWGSFGFGNRYGGSFTRAIPVEKANGIINCALGASVMVAMEDVTPDERLQNNQQHSPLFKDLAVQLHTNQALQAHRLELRSADVPQFMQYYDYQIAAWPFIISPRQVADFNGFIKPIAQVLYHAIELYFAENSEAFADYLNEPAIIHQMLRQSKVDSRDLLMRHDLAFSDGQFKLLEINVGSVVGGWQHDWINDKITQAFKLSDKTAGWNLTYRNVSEATFAAVCQSINRTKPGATGNVLLYGAEGDFEGNESFRQCNRQVFDQVSSFDQGGLFLFSDFDKIEFAPDGNVKYQGKIMDAVLLTVVEGVEIPKAVFMRLVSSYLAGKIVFPDNPFHTLLGNKLLLALVHEPALQTQLSAQALTLINNHIPWAAKSNASDVVWQGKTVNLQTLLKQNQSQFVIKKAHSAQGRDVCIGRFVSEQQWLTCIDETSSDNDWLVQTFCEPDQVIASSVISEPEPFTPVWGIFDLNNSYSGAFVRATVSEQGNGIINSANGALEFTVVEVRENKKRKLVL